MSMTPEALRLRHIATRMLNIDKHQLVDAGIMHDGVGGNDWTRFKTDPLLFIVKLDSDKLSRLATLIGGLS